MKLRNYILLITMTTFMLSSLQAQFFLKDHFVHKYKKDEIKLRWEPQSMEEWNESLTQGYTIVVFENNVKVLEKNLKPTSIDMWDRNTKGISNFKYQFYEGAKNMIYQDKVTEAEDKVSFTLRGQGRSAIDSFRLGMLLYTGMYDFNIVKMSGLGIDFKGKENASYTVSLNIGGKYERMLKFKAEKTKTEIPKLEGEWGDHDVKMKWNTLGFDQYYFGYILEKSTDGIRFSVKDSLPYVDNKNINTKEKETIRLIETHDSLRQNYVTYYYRIRGFDYFGEYSESQSAIMGYGFDKITISPMIIFADQTEKNKGHIKWKTYDPEMHLIEDFTLWRSDTLNGKYEVFKDSINKSSREIFVPLEFTINYFRIEANPKDGKSLSSAPIFIMGQDTTPPVKPIVLSAKVDSLNRAVVVWKSNKEPDLWGYRIFKSNFASDEFTLLNSSPIKDTLFIDTLNLKMGTENIFYLIEASDKRNNRSPMSDTIRLELPDIVPPATPTLVDITQEGKKIKIIFQNSFSKDLHHQNLYRKNIKKEKDWTLVNMWDTTYTELFVIDSSVLIGEEYAYALTAVDKSNLESKPSPPRVIKVSFKEEIFNPFKNITQNIDIENKKVTISWDCVDKEDIVSVLIYRGESKDKMHKHTYIESPLSTFTEAYDPKYVVYRIQPFYKSRLDQFFSEFIVLLASVDDEKK